MRTSVSRTLPVMLGLVFLSAMMMTGPRLALAQTDQTELPLPGRLVDVGGYRMHLWCRGTSENGAPTVVLSIGGGGFAVDWALVQLPLSDSIRVCSYDRPGYGWSDPGPQPRTLRQEAFDFHELLQAAGEVPPYVLVGHSIGAFVVRRFAAEYRDDVVGLVLVGPTNENGKLGYRGQWVLPRTLASDRQIPTPHPFAEPPPRPSGPDFESCRTDAARNARIWSPFDRLGVQWQQYRVWALAHPACEPWQDDYFAEEMADFYNEWATHPHPLDDLPLVVVMGTRKEPPPGLSQEELRSDSLRLDLSRLSVRGSMVADSLSGHHVYLENPDIVIRAIHGVLRMIRD